MKIVMVHPNLPGQEITVPEAAELGHRSMGWVTKEEADAAGITPELPPATAPESEPTKPAATSPRRTPSQPSGNKE